MKSQPIPDNIRFWRKVSKTKTCWLWTGYVNPDGYAIMKVGNPRHPQNAHRVSWIIHFGEPSEKVKISQKCGNRICVNPEHLQTGQIKEHQTFEQAFWKFAQKSKGCWKWNGEIDKDGYGRMKLPHSKGKRLAHRASWQVHNGEIPKGLCVLHKCDNPPCVNPDHLFLGTNRDNSDDMVRKNRQARGSKSGRAILTESDVLKIRKMYKSNGHNIVAISKAFPQVKRVSIHDVVYRYAWKHI
jgi:hypothetical protein